ncbi:cytochrome c peroxidase [Algicola sagamiensis]|uniref:cytochrome c peroxidase n=1 Tax=Algicola sagamiensis TaxID=163869 RepID=UPI0003A736D8|nr:cytochrome c peroxidase [Algicola sagamiensis]
MRTLTFMLSFFFVVFSTSANESVLDKALKKLIQQHQLTGEPTRGVDIPTPNDPEVKLGKLLFFSKSLSGDKDVACASCHHPYLGGGDGLALPIGTFAKDPDVLGPGRVTKTDQLYVPRNSPTIFNSWAYTRSLFRDARVELIDFKYPSKGISTPDVPYGEADPNAGEGLLEAQARFPTVSPVEMQGFSFEAGQPTHVVRAHLAARIGDYGVGQGEIFRNQWRQYFERVYGHITGTQEEIVTYENIANALAAYQRSMNFTNNPWFQYIRGDLNAIDDSVKRGAILYYTLPPPPSDGGDPPDELPTQCVGCHSEDTLTQSKGDNYHRLAFPQIGPGTNTGPSETGDIGRMARNGKEADIFSFRSPTLLNIEVTGPYGHAGNYKTLEEVMDHYNDFHKALNKYFDNSDWCKLAQFKNTESCESLFPNAKSDTQPAIDIVDDEIADGAPVLRPLGLDEQELADMVAFMKALTDPCVKSALCLQPWLPQPEDGDPDGLLLHPKNDQGVPLNLKKDCTNSDTITSGQSLQWDQMECISGQAHHFYVDVEMDNTTLYISTSNGQGKSQIFYRQDDWAMPHSAKARSEGNNTNQVLIVTANRGRHYILIYHPQGYQQLGVAVSQDSANREPGEQPKSIHNACQQMLPTRISQLNFGQPLCAANHRSFFFFNVPASNQTIEIRTDHGQGNLNLFTGQNWPSQAHHDFSSTQNGSREFLRLDSIPKGWYFITLEGGTTPVSIQIDLQQ